MCVVRIAALALCLVAFPALAAVDVTTCGQFVPAKQVGRLAADLTCASGPGVILEDGARLKRQPPTGEILVSSTVKELVLGSAVRFADKGERVDVGELARAMDAPAVCDAGIEQA